jgi:repressor LexA
MRAAFSPTHRQLRVLRWITGFQAANDGASPTLRDIAAGVGLCGKASVHEALVGLERRGLIRRLQNRNRAIEVLAPPPIPRAPDGAPLFVVPGSFLESGSTA